MEFRQDYNIPFEDMKDPAAAIFVLTDDLYNESVADEIKNRLNKDKAIMSDSEIITIAIMGEIMSIDSENAWVRYVRKNMHDLFPRMCERSRFNRLRRNLSSVTEYIRVKLGSKLDFTEDDYRIVDSLPFRYASLAEQSFAEPSRVKARIMGTVRRKRKLILATKFTPFAQ